MRVLYIVSLFPCWSETFIVREIAAMIKLGVDVRIVSLKHPTEELIQSDAASLLDRVVYPAPWWRSLPAALGAIARHPIRELADLITIAKGLARSHGSLAKTLVVWWRSLGLLGTARALAPTHLHAHWATYPSTSAWLLSKRLGIPYSFTAHAHDIFLEDHLLATKLATAKFVSVISAFNRRYLEERIAGADRARFELVHCGISLDAFPFVRDGRDLRRILAVGRLDGIKGFRHLVDACGKLQQAGIDFQCDIVGDGPLREELAAQIAALGLANRVHLAGARKQEEVSALLYRAGIFVLPSVVTPSGGRDGIPVALMEAMACGAPVVSTTVSGIPELIESNVTGLLAPPGDADGLARCIRQLLENEALCERLAASARTKIEDEFDITKEAARLHHAIANP